MRSENEKCPSSSPPFSLFALLSLLLAGSLVLTACEDDDQKGGLAPVPSGVGEQPAGEIGAVTMRVFAGAEPVDPQGRVWYRMVTTEEGQQLAYENAEDAPLTWIDHEGESVWHTCETYDRPEHPVYPEDVPPFCYFEIASFDACDDKDCRYEFYASKEALAEGLNAENSWSAKPEAWVSSVFNRSAELGTMADYEVRYDGLYPERLLSGQEPPIEVTIGEDTLTISGWARRHGLLD